jgi:hypothetical protein
VRDLILRFSSAIILRCEAVNPFFGIGIAYFLV